MPLIILTGYPCSGLSYRAKQLAQLLEETQNQLFDALDNENNTTGDDANQEKPKQKRFTFHIVPSHDPGHPRTVYDHARTEKEARAVAYARVKRALAKDAFVILDGMNYIKGYRYQLWCEAKAVGTTCCVVHVGTPIDKCVAINNSRLNREASSALDNLPETTSTTDDLAEPDTEEPYPSDLHQNLIFRYEEPSTHSRWDKPLFTVPWSDARPPVEEIWTAATGIEIEKNFSSDTPEAPTTTTTTISPIGALLHTDPNNPSPSTLTTAAVQPSDTASIAYTIRTTNTQVLNGGRLGRPRIKPHQATVQPAQTDSGALYNYEKKTSAIVTAIRNYTSSNPSAEAALAQSTTRQGVKRADEEGISITVPDASIPVFIPAHIVRSAPTDDLAGAGGLLTLPRLQRLRRQWISQNRTYIGMTHNQVKGALGVEQIGDAFVRFLNFEFAGNTPE
uniref:Protein kti12 n=1 Tax=Talaromyces marneffei PM1 TaxID=1077442 RepID=A0A093VDZ0_TALMA